MTAAVFPWDLGSAADALKPAHAVTMHAVLVLPALASAHDHARVVRLSQVGSFDVPLEATSDWA